MPNLCSFDDCCGCSACFAACPKRAISMVADREGFLRPEVKEDACVNCKLCERVCPVLNRGEPREPLAVYGTMAKDEAMRLTSSSGGMFTLLAREVLRQGGIVFGAAIREGDCSIGHRSAETEEELEWLRRSKYVQSDVGDTYRQVKVELDKGRLVMFTGTPCQIAGLRSYLNLQPSTSTSNLLLVDVICHAAPSPLAWQKYLRKREGALAQGRGSARAEGPIAKRISFRRKNCGWKRFSLSLRFANDKEYLGILGVDTFLRGFLNELFNRKSCYDCQYKNLRSGSDITLGDYWNVHVKFPDFDDDKGTSLVLVNTEKGARFYAAIRPLLTERVSDFTDAKRSNPALWKSPLVNPNRQAFFDAVESPDFNFDKVTIRLTMPPLGRRIYIKLRGWLRALTGI
ncbi:MAG: Coenzyme F420 hydrogenase/dehydrogenase, beta subunit C-terminal domain [Kiritimatiellae bacterium]|nr:Coenzyme F420 hydrogenase/dehydrogenase, beta subunit C-terminal domain [Kiritimatiellia bacterium]